MKFTGCELSCGTYLALMHCVMGRHTEVGELTLRDCYVKTGKTAIEVRGQNVVVELDVAQMDAPEGVTIHAVAQDGQGIYTLASGGTLSVE